MRLTTPVPPANNNRLETTQEDMNEFSSSEIAKTIVNPLIIIITSTLVGLMAGGPFGALVGFGVGMAIGGFYALAMITNLTIKETDSKREGSSSLNIDASKIDLLSYGVPYFPIFKPTYDFYEQPDYFIIPKGEKKQPIQQQGTNKQTKLPQEKMEQNRPQASSLFSQFSLARYFSKITYFRQARVKKDVNTASDTPMLNMASIEAKKMQ